MNLGKILNADYATVFMLHRVHPLEVGRLRDNELLKISPEFLRHFIADSKRRGIVFISLDELCRRISGNQSLRRTAVITLDDGYKDNFDFGFPVFLSENVPFCLYVSTDMPDGKTELWWHYLEDQLLRVDAFYLGGLLVNCSTVEEKNHAFLLVREKVLGLPPEHVKNFLESLFEQSFDIASYNFKYALQWKNIEEMSKSSLCTIAAHTISHPNLKMLSPAKVLFEMSESKLVLESHIAKSALHFAYPFGSASECGEREYLLAKEAGFASAVISSFGCVFSDTTNFYSLPRVTLNPGFRWRKLWLRLLVKKLRSFYK